MSRFRMLLPTILDLVVPIVIYYVLHSLGVDDFWALTIAGVGTGVYTVVNTIRRRKLDFIGILVILEIALFIGLFFVTDDPRLIAAKPAFYTALAGLYLLFTCVVGKPVVYEAATAIATKGDPVRTDAYHLAWDESAKFRLIERGITAAFGLGLLLEAVLRVFIVYHWSPAKIGESFAISQLPGIVLLVLVLGFVRTQVPTISAIVDKIEERLRANPAEAAPQTPSALTK